MAISLRSFLTEFICTFWFIFFAVGSLVTNTEMPNVGIALTFGFAFAALVYCAGGVSGGQLNPAVTVALMITKHVSCVQGALNIAAQFLGSIFASLMVYAMTPKKEFGPFANGHGLNWAKQELEYEFNGQTYDIYTKETIEYPIVKVIFFELFATFFLMYVIYATAVDKVSMTRTSQDKQPIMAPLAIGLAVFACHMLLLPVNGCSLNPARSFGPWMIQAIVVSTFDDHPQEPAQAQNDAINKQIAVQQLVYIFVPMIGAAMAAGFFYLESFLAKREEEKQPATQVQATADVPADV